MKVLLVDNYDSFTWNLYHDLAEAFGEQPLLVRNDAPLEQRDLTGLAAIVLSPGPGHPAKERDFGLCRNLIAESRLPLLGVCLGHQGLCHHYGASVIRAPEAVHGRLSCIQHDSTGLFEGLPSPLQVVRYHSLLATEIPDALRVTATTSEGLVMAVAHRSRPQWGVQFHPESICTEHGTGLVKNFARLVRSHVTSAGPRKDLGMLHSAPTPPCAVRQHAPSATRPLRMRHRVAPLSVTSEALFAELFDSSSRAFFLDSSLRESELGRYSIMGDGSGPIARSLTASVRDGTLRVEHGAGVTEVRQSVFDFLEQDVSTHTILGPRLSLPFQLGWVGYLGYELKAQCGGEPAYDAETADATLLFADRALVLDHLAGEVHTLCLVDEQDASQREEAAAFLARVERALNREAPLPEPSAPDPESAHLGMSRAEYLRRIAHCQEAIRDGESYEICLTQRITGPLKLDPFMAYRHLRRHNPAPFAAYLRMGTLHVLSSSPERMLSVSRDGVVETRPIKGTRARSSDPVTDAALAADLARNEKDRAENLMIVDLSRNDLGRCAELGSVRVPRLFAVETYAHVHQLVSTVVAQLGATHSPLDAVRASFPGGSMTGAPKLRTMELLDKLETGPRGIYSGALGYFSLCGAVDLSMVIRTLVVQHGRFSLGVGGAIVAMSEPEQEFEELLVKARSVLGALNISLAEPPLAVEDDPRDDRSPV